MVRKAVVSLAKEVASEVDLATCAEQSELLSLLSKQEAPPFSLEFERFPGGIGLLRSVLSHSSAAVDRAGPDRPENLSDLVSPPFAADSFGAYLEAAILFQSASLIRDLVLSPVCKELSSRHALPVLEQAVLLTGSSLVGAWDEAPLNKILLCGKPHQLREWSEDMETAFAEMISQLCARLDPRDFRLGPALARGSAEASLEVLRAYRAKYEETSLGIDSTLRSTATLSVLGTQSMLGSQLGEWKDGKRVEWTEHQFALHVLRLHLERETARARSSGTARRPRAAPGGPAAAEPDADPAPDGGEDGGSEGSGSSVFNECVEEEDVAEDVCDEVPDVALARLAHLAAHLDTSLVPPVLAAAMIRAWLMVRKEDRADALFQATFPRSAKVRTMVVEREIPVAFLRGVQKHRAASVTLRRMLARYESAGPAEICDLIEDLLFEEFMAEEHAYRVILKHDITRQLILWMRSGGLPGGADIGAPGFADGTAPPEHVKRLREVGERLFEVAFALHGGFLPDGARSGGARGGQDADADARGCLWDTGALDLPLLSCVPPTEDSLQLARRVLLRSVRRRHRGRAVDVPALARDWPLGRWPLCHDPELIGEAFALLGACWRVLASLPGLGDLAGLPPAAAQGLAALGGGGRRGAEGLLFRMFTDLEVWRLPPRELLTPWVPGQVLACHVAAQCKKLEDRQLTLVEETRENLEEIARLHAVIAQLSGRLEATDARSEQCMQKQADLNDTLRHLR